jgi:subtilisin family serine protease
MKPVTIHRGTGAVLSRMALMAAVLTFFLSGVRSVSANPDAAYSLSFAAVDTNSTLYLTNGSQTNSAAVSVTPYNPDTGAPLAPTTLTIPAAGSAAVLGSDLKLSASKLYGVTVGSDNPVQATVFFQDPSKTDDSLAVYNGSNSLVTNGDYGPIYYLYADSRATGQMTTEFYLFNPSTTQTVNISLFNLNGNSAGTFPVQITAGQTKLLQVGGSTLKNIPTNFSGRMSISAQNGVAITQIQRRVTTIEAGHGLTVAAQGADTLYHASLARVLKSYADGKGTNPRTSRLAVVNTKAQSQNITLAFHPIGSSNQTIGLTQANVGSGEMRWFVMPNYTALPAGQAYSVDVSAPGPFELGDEIEPDSLVGQAGGDSRVGIGSLRLSGIVRSAAWFSQITLQNQSLTPAAFSLMYLAADGTPLLSQTLEALPAGTSRRIDLRSLGALGTSFTGSLLIQAGADQAIAASVDEFANQGEAFFKINMPLTGNNFWPCMGTDYLQDTYYPLIGWDMALTRADELFAKCQYGSPSVVVAVVDTGVDLTHPDLVENILPGTTYLNGKQLGLPKDDNGHGTHVSGTIAARINGIGVVGVAPGVKILPVKVLDADGSGSSSDVASGIKWAADHGANVINLSLGGTVDSSVVYNAVNYALQKGVVVVAAGGNSNGSKKCNNCTSYPAAYPGVLAVAAVDELGVVADFSNYGDYIAIAAPGEKNKYEGIWSTYPGGNYEELSGTSMASPHVAGLAAQILSVHPGYSVAQVTAAIEKTALLVNSTGWNPYYGFGIIQVDKAVAYDASSVLSQEIPQESAPAVDQRDQPIASGYVIVFLRPGTDEARLAQELARLGLARSGAGSDALLGEKISVPVGQEWSMIDQLRKLDGIETAEPDYVMSMK